MIATEETTSFPPPLPGFAGFIPSLKYEYGVTYGNATRHILATDPSLKQGEVQREYARRVAELRAQRQPAEPRVREEDVWKGKQKYTTADDRFSFPPVPGYTGYIPRSQEHFGRPYVETTNASLADFMQMLKSKAELPARVQAIKDQQKPRVVERHVERHQEEHSGHAHGRHVAAKRGAVGGDKPSFAYSAASSPIDYKSPYKLPAGHPEKTFISGYTGFVSRLQNHFGEPYSDSVRKAIDEFTAPKQPRGASKEAERRVKTNPIPGFTGFVPGSKYGFATTFGKTTEIAYENFNNRDEKGNKHAMGAPLPRKQLSESQPIPGYKGHIPNYIFAAERSYGVSSKECIKEFVRQKNEGTIRV
ncbi:hypothetical protein HK101_003657 [Irineochytrium annulatum]|nr:hypothetical protein HK101_003657 [Irineochytrium annulatum]